MAWAGETSMNATSTLNKACEWGLEKEAKIRHVIKHVHMQAIHNYIYFQNASMVYVSELPKSGYFSVAVY